MALEKSSLNRETMRSLLLSEYGFRLIEESPLSLGSANCFKIRCKEGVFFLKEYQSSFSFQDVEKEAALVEFLLSKGFPVARFFLTVNGAPCTLHCGHVICVQELIEGKTYLNDLPRPLLLESAKYLGRIHTLLIGYALKTDMDEKWVQSFSPEEASGKYDALLLALDHDSTDPNYKRIREDLLFKKELSYRISDLKSYYDGITYTPTHGDYTACQMICGEDHIKAIIDFSSAATLPAVWEIMRAYIQSSGACRGGAPFDTADFVLYVKKYMEEALLSQRDLEAMPYVYLFQLARSSYGYREYLITKTENRDALLEFAMWRTDICREIYHKAAEISDALSQLRVEGGS